MDETTKPLGDDKIVLLRKLLALVDDSEISSIKSTVAGLIKLINDPKSNAGDLKEVIELDPPLTAKLLKLANSAYFGFPRTVGDIREAVVCVGFNEIKELALNQKISQVFKGSDAFAGYSKAMLWKHSVSVAICGKLIYTRELNRPGGNAYMVGLLHDIGIIIEDQFLLDAFFRIIDSYRAGDADFMDLEHEHLGYDHTDIGHAIAISWNFPEDTATAIRCHHRPLSADDEAAELTCVLHIADIACQQEKIGFGDAAGENSAMFQQCLERLNSCAKTKVNDKKIGAIMEEVVENITKMEKTGWF